MYKKQFVCVIQVILFLSMISLSSVFAETIILKSGERIEGKIIERTDQYIRIEIAEGTPFTYWFDEIEQIEEEVPTLPEIKKYFIEYCLNKRYDDALLLLEKAKELDPNNPDLYAGLGMLYYYLGRFQEAISACEKTLSLSPNYPAAHVCLGVVYDSIGQEKEAKENLSKAIELYKEEGSLGDVFVVEALLKRID